MRGRPNEGYFGAVGGGLWKTTDRGETWLPVTDGQIHSSSVGAVAVSETNPDLVYIGMGESCIRGNAMSGDGVYKSTNGGRTWSNVTPTDMPDFGRVSVIDASSFDPGSACAAVKRPRTADTTWSAFKGRSLP